MIKRKPSKIGYVIILTLLIAGFFWIKEKKNQKKIKDKLNMKLTRAEVALPYRTINAPDSDDLFSYKLVANEFYKDLDGMPYQEFSAILKTVDLSKDDYKTYCTTVIKDILKTTPTGNVTVYLYDDYDAYQSSELNVSPEFKALSVKEKDSMDRHTIAAYYCQLGNEGYDRALWFFPETHNKLTEKVLFEP
jgi:hypothetical protein